MGSQCVFIYIDTTKKIVMFDVIDPKQNVMKTQRAQKMACKNHDYLL